MANLVGKTIGRYRVVARLGRGGMAEVYKAYQPGLDRYVAVKTLHSHLVEDEDFIGRFEREAHAIGRLRHPNIVQALDFDREGEMYFMVMEYIDGPTLKDETKARKAANKPFTLPEVGRVFSALCNAIAYAHSRGMVHRDLKPANVMINQQGQIVLTDFGIARIVGATQFTATGALSGTPAYMSPEQGQGEKADERSDIYSLGVMLYEMVTGIVPYDADTPFAVIMKHINEPLPMPRTVNPDIPEPIERVILKAMSKNPDDRFQKAGEMAVALRQAAGFKPGDENIPLTIVAPPPKVDQVEHATGPITAQERAASAALYDSNVTEITSDAGATAVTGASKGLPIVPIVIGGVVIIGLIAAVILGMAFLGGGDSGGTPEQDELAIAAVTSTAEAKDATATANAEATEAALEAEALAEPTQTAAAETRQAEQAIAKQTADAALIAGVFAARDATATAMAGEALATAEAATAEAQAATAEAQANATPTPEPEQPTDTPAPADTPTPAAPADTPTPAPPADTPTPERPAISGKLAFPVDDGAGKYDVYIVSMPDGNELGLIKGARQPNFRSDGVKLLVNGQGGGFGENVFQATPNGNIEKAVSGSPTDSHPVYNLDGGRIAFGNDELTVGSDGNRHPYIFVQCGVRPPSEEGDEKCVDIARFGILVPDGQIGEIQGSNPVWATNDHIFYKGCNSWAGGGSCGMFTVASWANKRSSNGETPRKVADGTSVIPTDAKVGLVAYHSRETGNWEAYVMGLDGGGVVNISNSPNSSDGLPTISPDGQWVAFASDREGAWAVYVAPSSGGAATKVFAFPKGNPWGGGGDRDWTNERMSWGP